MRAAIYARYSTDNQNPRSIEDQFRVCERIAEQNGFTIVGHYSDEAVSGGTVIKRLDYQKLLRDARNDKFDVIIAEELSRFWRCNAEQGLRLGELRDLEIAIVTQDVDSRQDSSGMVSAMKGAMNEEYRRDIARKTRRGLEGCALRKRPTGGRAYGYISAADSHTGDREINEKEAEVVRRIFRDYANGLSAAAICAELNKARIPSPGSAWNRSTRRANGWVTSAVAGDRKKGNGILNNPVYTGRIIWGRNKWKRSAIDSSKRKVIQNSRKDWVEYHDERLRIVPQSLWDAVKRRQANIDATIGKRIAEGIAKSAAGQRPKHLLSGLLRCGACGSNFVVWGKGSYSCSSYVHGKACTNSVRLKQSVVEPLLLDGIRTRLIQPTVIEEARRRVVSALKKSGHGDESLKARAETLKAEVANLTDAIASGVLRASKAIAERLAGTETELERIETQLVRESKRNVTDLTPRIKDKLLEAAANLPAVIRKTNAERGRAAIAAIVGDITVKTTDSEIRFESAESAVEQALLRTAGAEYTIMVAGAGFEPATFGL